MSEEELKAKNEKESEESSAADAAKYLQSVKESLLNVSLSIIEGCATEDVAEDLGKLDDTEKKSSSSASDSQSSIIIISNFLLDVSKTYPELENKLASELLGRMKGNVDVKSSSVSNTCQRNGCVLAFGMI